MTKIPKLNTKKEVRNWLRANGKEDIPKAEIKKALKDADKKVK